MPSLPIPQMTTLLFSMNEMMFFMKDRTPLIVQIIALTARFVNKSLLTYFFYACSVRCHRKLASLSAISRHHPMETNICKSTACGYGFILLCEQIDFDHASSHVAIRPRKMSQQGSKNHEGISNFVPFAKGFVFL